MKLDMRQKNGWKPAGLLVLLVLQLPACSVVGQRPNGDGANGTTALHPVEGETPLERAIAAAIEQQGIPYRRGGAGPRGFDCSGLVQYAYSGAGFVLPRTSADQFHATVRVERADLKPGDLVFFRVNSRHVSHVGIYLGDGRFIHAPSPGKDVMESRLDDPYWNRRYVGGGRPVLPAGVASGMASTTSDVPRI
jgi:cell wall-associated NlpC family hydrolase